MPQLIVDTLTAPEKIERTYSQLSLPTVTALAKGGDKAAQAWLEDHFGGTTRARTPLARLRSGHSQPTESKDKGRLDQ